MEKNILNEVQRIREIMGVSLIQEQWWKAIPELLGISEKGLTKGLSNLERKIAQGFEKTGNRALDNGLARIADLVAKNADKELIKNELANLLRNPKNFTSFFETLRTTMPNTYNSIAKKTVQKRLSDLGLSGKTPKLKTSDDIELLADAMAGPRKEEIPFFRSYYEEIFQKQNPGENIGKTEPKVTEPTTPREEPTTPREEPTSEEVPPLSQADENTGFNSATEALAGEPTRTPFESPTTNTEELLEDSMKRLRRILMSAKTSIPKKMRLDFLREIQRTLRARMESLTKRYSNEELEAFMNDPGFVKTLDELENLPIKERKQIIQGLKEELGDEYRGWLEKVTGIPPEVKKLFIDAWNTAIDFIIQKQYWKWEEVKGVKSAVKALWKWWWNQVKMNELYILIATGQHMLARFADADGDPMKSLFEVGGELGSGATKLLLAMIPIIGPIYSRSAALMGFADVVSSGYGAYKRYRSKTEDGGGSFTDLILDVKEAKDYVENGENVIPGLPNEKLKGAKREYKPVENKKNEVDFYLNGQKIGTLEKVWSNPLTGGGKIKTIQFKN